MDERDVYRAKETVRSAMRQGPLRLAGIAGIFVVGFVLLHPWVQVGAGESGVVLNFGAVQESVLGEGLHFRVPVMQRIALMDVKVQKAVTDAASASSDLQDVTSSVALNYHIIPDKANVVYQTLGVQFKERIIDPAIQEVMKAVTAQYVPSLDREISRLLGADEERAAMATAGRARRAEVFAWGAGLRRYEELLGRHA